jgi:ribonuclease Z
MRKRWILVMGALALAAVGVANQDAILIGLFSRAVERAVVRDVVSDLDPKGIHIAFCGTGAPLPDRSRAEACTAIWAGGRLFVFDSGEGSAETLSLMGMPLGKIAGVWLTHLHSDHFEGLGALMLQRWAGSAASTPLPVNGPEGVLRITSGLNEAFAIDAGFRMAHHGEAVVPKSGYGLSGKTIIPGVVYNEGGVRITAFRVAHGPVDPAFGYRLDYGGHSVTLSGDTSKSAEVARTAKQSDVLVHEALSVRMVKIIAAAAAKAGQVNRTKILTDIQNYHTTPEQAAETARDANVGVLAFTHIVPAVPSRLLEGAFVGDARTIFPKPVWVMHDGDLISINSDGAVTRKGMLR